MLHIDTLISDDVDLLDIDEAADTMRFYRIDPDATGIYDLDAAPMVYVGRSAMHRRKIRDTQQEIVALRAAIAAGWDVVPELAFVEQQLAHLEGHA
jgi:hypothetical protein